MSGRVRSLNVGAPRPMGPGGRMSGFDKRPVASIDVVDPGPRDTGLGSGVVGDAVLNRVHHGGWTQAVYAFAREELDGWAERLGRDIPDGWFAENMTTTGIDVDAALVGERWRVGSALLEVCGPRKPCATFALRMGVPGWGERFVRHGRTGAYLAVVEPGTIRTGDTIEVVSRPAHDVDMTRLLRALEDPAAAAGVLAVGCLHEPERVRVEKVLGKQA